MSLRVWLPLNGSLENKGLDDITVTNNGATVDNNGKIGKCYSFGASSYLKIPLSKLSEYSTTTFSMCLWAKVPSPTSGNKQLLHIGKGSGWANNRFTILYQGSTTVSRIVTSISDGSSYGAYSCYADIPIDTWIHIASVFDNRKLKLYINGELKNTYNTTYDLSFTSIEALGVGGAPNGAELLKSGYINDVRIYDHALSPLEVKHIAQGLILHYPLNRNGWGNENLALNTHNLNLNSNKNNLYMYFRGAATRRLRADGFYEAYCTGDWQGLSFWANQLNLKSGDKITYSFYIYTNGTSCGYSFYPMIYNSSGSRDTSTTFPISIDGDNYINGNARTFGNTTTTFPEKHYVTFEWNDSVKAIIDNGGSIELSIQVSGGNWTNRWACIYAPKIEKGDKVTPWCPNSSDELATTLGMNDNIEYDCSGYCNNGEYYAYDTNGSISYTSDTPKYNVSTHIASANPTQNAASGTRYLYGHCELMNPTQMSVTFWLKPITGGYGGTTSNGQGYFCTTNYEYGNTSVGVDYQESAMNHRDGTVDMNDSASATQCRVTFYPTIGEWHHYVYTYDGQIGRGYKDGVQTATAQFSAAKTLDSFIGVVIGFSKAGGVWRRNDACYSDFRVYATALSEEDVKDLYNLGASIDSNNNLLTYELNEE